MLACLVFLAGGLGVWLMVALLFYVRQLERREAKELEEIAAAAKGGTIFQDERAALRPAAARRAWTEQWVVPIFTFLWAGYQAATGVWIGRRMLTPWPTCGANRHLKSTGRPRRHCSRR